MHHDLDVHPIPKQPFYINEPTLIDPSLGYYDPERKIPADEMKEYNKAIKNHEFGRARWFNRYEEDEPDNIRVYIPLDLNVEAMKIIVNGLDCDGSAFREVNGTARPGRRSSLNSGHFKLTPERVAEAPDFLHFERGMYAAFITKGIVHGDIIEYHTNFGVKLPAISNNRTLGSFLGFKRCRDDGTVEIFGATYKVDGGKIRYSRREKKRWKGGNEEEIGAETAEE